MLIYTKEDSEKIIKAFINNKILIMLTDTVYGIMALATKENEDKINKLKKSSLDKKLSIIFSDLNNLYNYINIDKDKLDLVKSKLPGKYTFIVNLNNFSNFNRNDFGIRITTNNYLQTIIKSTGPILATSCNISGNPVCTTKEEIISVFGNEDVILVSDKDANNEASTIIDIREDIKIIRK